MARRPGREASAKIQEQRRHQEQRPDIEPVNEPVEDIELPRSAQRVNRERSQAKSVEPGSRWILTAALVDQQPDQRVGPAENQEDAGHTTAADAFANDD